jgi:hypothetical protein
MGGGNFYEVSDISVAMKWFYNCVHDASIIQMQPEESTAE